MKRRFLDINVDVGEGFNNESQIMPYIYSCNIACGGHAGDNDSMKAVVKLAKKHNVKIGAHPSFPDKAHFGRKIVEMSSANLYTSLMKQIRGLIHILSEEHIQLRHIKPHGALYNLAAVDSKTANVIIEAVKSIAYPLKLYAPYGSVIANLAEKEKIPVTYEVFADRNYNNDLTLVSRREEKAVISNSKEVIEHTSRMLLKGKVKTIQGNELDIMADTFCIHGDNPKAVDLIKKLKEHFG